MIVANDTKKAASLLKIFNGIWENLEWRHRKKIISLLIIILLSGFAEICTLASVFPFLAFLTNPDKFWEISLVNKIFTNFGYSNTQGLLLPITLSFCFLSVLSALIRLTTLRMNSYTAAYIGTYLSCKTYSNSLLQSYEQHIIRNSSQVITTSTSLIDSTVAVINLGIQLINAIFIVICITITLLSINFLLSVYVFSIFLVSYFILGFTVRKRLNNNSRFIVDSRKKQIKILQEGLSGIREIIIDQLKNFYIDKYTSNDSKRRQKEAESEFLSMFPRYAFEAIGLVSISFFAYLATTNSEDSLAIIPLIGSFAFGSQRLLPLMQLAYASWAGIKYNSSGAYSVINFLREEITLSAESLDIKNNKFTKTEFKKISLRNISYSYPGDSKKIINNLNLEIKKGDKIGIMGPTGGGKSTLLDLIMGLLIPTSGKIYVNNEDIHNHNYPERLLNWYRTISAVSQDIYLSDCSILENIAIGVKEDQIDMNRINFATKLAELNLFINSLKYGLKSKVGERGISMSGGQKQRIGLARAFFKNSPLLILDEATSALDPKTETKIVSNVNSLGDKKTIIMIAHRPNALSSCNRLIYVEHGAILYDGEYSKVYSKLVNTGKI